MVLENSGTQNNPVLYAQTDIGTSPQQKVSFSYRYTVLYGIEEYR